MWRNLFRFRHTSSAKRVAVANGVDSKGRPKKSWINWLAFKNWYNSQETAQLMRRAPTVSQTRSGMPPPNDMVPFARMQADLADFGEMAFNQYRYLMIITDVVTGFTVLQTWRGAVNNRQTSRVVKEFIDVVRKWLGGWPRQTLLQTDNGTADFGQEFKETVEEYEPLIRVTHGVPHRPNSQGSVESSVRNARGVLKRLLRSKGLGPKQWKNHLVEAGFILNSRPSERLGWVSPVDAFNAFLGDSEADKKLAAKVHSSIYKTVQKRRGPGSKAGENQFKIGDQVRLASDEYMKTAKSLRGNDLKFGPVWSEDVYRITQKNRPGANAPLQYKISDGTGKWHPHEMLMKLPGVEKPPDAATADRDDYEIEKVLDYNPSTRKYLVLYTGYWQPEWQSPNMVPANLRDAFRAS